MKDAPTGPMSGPPAGPHLPAVRAGKDHRRAAAWLATIGER